MSQRKEKYLRHTLDQYDGIARDVDYLNNRVAVIGRDLDMVRDAQAEMARTIARERQDRRRAARREQRRRRNTGVTVLVALAAVLAAIVVARVWAEEPAEAAGAAQQAQTAITMPEPEQTTEPVAIQTAEEPETPAYYCEAVPLTAEEQMELFNAADAFDVWYPLAIAMVETETSFRNVAGDSGASIGYLQVNATLHTELMEQVGATDLWKPRDNFRTGLAYLAQQLERCETVHMALMAYNMGPSGAARAWQGGVYETEYSKKIVERADYWAGVLGWKS